MSFVEKAFYQPPKWPFFALKSPFKLYQPLTVGDQNGLDPIPESLGRKEKLSQAVRYLILFCAGFLSAVLLFLFSFYFQGGMQDRREGLFQTPIPLEPITILPQLHESSWTNLLPNGDGMIYIPKPSQFDLPPGLPSGTHERKKYGISWTHQTHCLMMIRDEYRLLLTNESNFVKGEENLDREGRYRFHHIGHCFDYLRQMVECSADMTVEWAADEPDELGGEYHINGYGVEHQCRSREFVRGFMEGHRAPGSGHSDVHEHNYNV